MEPAISRSSVDLPLALGPRMATSSRSRAWKVVASSVNSGAAWRARGVGVAGLLDVHAHVRVRAGARGGIGAGAGVAAGMGGVGHAHASLRRSR